MSNGNQTVTESRISVVIPGYNAERYIDALGAAFAAQTRAAHEVLFIDDGSTDRTAERAAEYFHVVRMLQNKGPAAARNCGIETATGDVIAFTDCDCRPEPDWIEWIERRFCEPDMQVLMGAIQMLPSGWFGDSVSALGFPAGGSLGFERVWRVAEDGRTDHISSCNFAARAAVFTEHGAFDTDFRRTYGEDAELSFRLTRAGVPIVFCPELLVRHPALASGPAFVRNQIARGRGNCRFKRKVGPVRTFVRLRLWSSANIVRAYCRDPKFPLILCLLALSFCLQQWGYVLERSRKSEVGSRK